MAGRLEGKVAVVTGGASGIGAATARLLAGEGAAVVVMDLREVPAPAGAGRFLSMIVDLGDTTTVPPALARVIQELGRCDILVNCAGVTGEARVLADTELDDWDRVLRVNLTAPMLLIKAFAEHAVARGGGGRIVNVSSSSAYRARTSPPAYAASKAALSQLTRSVAAELGPHDINVNTVAPGLTATPIATGAIPAEELQKAVSEGPLANLLHRVSEAEDVAEAILFLCLPGSRQITGQVLHTSAGAVI
jgi:NAD(P)-dependent dehydrogenase (short-subunit alcohol dehydrogenase family)